MTPRLSNLSKRWDEFNKNTKILIKKIEDELGDFSEDELDTIVDEIDNFKKDYGIVARRGNIDQNKQMETMNSLEVKLWKFIIESKMEIMLKGTRKFSSRLVSNIDFIKEYEETQNILDGIDAKDLTGIKKIHDKNIKTLMEMSKESTRFAKINIGLYLISFFAGTIVSNLDRIWKSITTMNPITLFIIIYPGLLLASGISIGYRFSRKKKR